MTLRFFIDDSGKNDPPVFVLGGAVFDVARLTAFEDSWNAALAASPSIPFLKMKDANARKGAFKGMSNEDRDAKLEALGSALADHAVSTISITVRHDDYERIYGGRMMRWMDRPYQMMFHLMIATGFMLAQGQEPGTSGEFVFDRQLEHEEALREAFPALRSMLEPSISDFMRTDPRHADDRDEVGLQAADMVAWHVRRTWRDGVDGIPRASAAGPKIASLPERHVLFDEDRLRHFANVAKGAVRNLNTVFPYEADRLAADFPEMATIVNLHHLAEAMPLQPVELTSFPAIGTGRFRLVSSCEALGRPHLHRRSGNRCLGEATVA